MTSREYLERLRTLDRHIDALLLERGRALDMALRVTVDPAADRVQAGRPANRVEDGAIRLAELAERIDAEFDCCVDLKEEAKALIARMGDPRFRDLLTCRHVNKLRWEAVSEKMAYEIRQVFRLHGFALLAFERVFKVRE